MHMQSAPKPDHWSSKIDVYDTATGINDTTAQEIIELTAQIYRNPDITDGPAYEEMFRDTQGTPEKLLEHLGRSGGRVYAVRHVSKQNVIGVLDASLHIKRVNAIAEQRDGLTAATYVDYINHLVVDPQYRGRRMASALHRRFEQDSESLRAKFPRHLPFSRMMNLHVQNNLAGVKAMCDRWGYREIGQHPSFDDLIVLEKAVDGTKGEN